MVTSQRRYTCNMGYCQCQILMANLGHSSIHRVTHKLLSCNIVPWETCVMHGTAIQTAALESRTSQLVALRIADNTANVYESGARSYIRFAMFYRYTPILLASDAALVAFVAFQSQSCSHDTLQGYIPWTAFEQGDIMCDIAPVRGTPTWHINWGSSLRG